MPNHWLTPRLRIRQFRADDWRDLYELHGDPQAMQFLGGVWSEQKTREVLSKIIAAYEQTELEWLAVADRNTDAVLGVCWLNPLQSKWCDALGIGPSIQLGYRYARKHWGQGYATEAARAMLQRGFNELNLSRIVAIVDVNNTASERVLQKLRMTCTGSAECDGIRIRGYALEQNAWLQIEPTR